ncbi:MAG: histidine kinase dimerization/phospho-acceptor domain-containing protein [Pseudomonadota bacterium]
MNVKKVKVKSLAQELRWQLLIIAGILFVVSVFLSSLLTLNSIETTTRQLMLLDAESTVRAIQQNPSAVTSDGLTRSIYFSWGSIPIELRQLFSETGEKPNNTLGLMLEEKHKNAFAEDEFVYLYHHFEEGFGDLFIISFHNAEDITRVSDRFFLSTLQFALITTTVTFIILFFLIRWLFKRTSEPLKMLTDWATKLSSDKHASNKHVFPISELNLIAQQLQQGIDEIESCNRREQEFLRYASHELRTPLSIIQASLDTLEATAIDTQTKTLERA